MITTNETKTCTKCGEEKALEEFHRCSRAKDGRKSHCKSCVKAYRQANRERRLEYNREYYQANRERKLEHQREYNQANRERRLEYNREYYQANRERIVKRQLAYEKERHASDPIFALANRCRNRIGYALRGKGFSKGSSTAEMIGCTWEELAAHIESQFADSMTWDNRSEWHIDHIVPLASAETEEELLALNHYTNLQPLWAEDNFSKGARLDWAAEGV